MTMTDYLFYSNYIVRRLWAMDGGRHIKSRWYDM